MAFDDNTTVKIAIRAILKRFGFATASDEMKLDSFSWRQLNAMLDSWSNYPACMDIYPKRLTKKPYYNEEAPVVRE